MALVSIPRSSSRESYFDVRKSTGERGNRRRRPGYDDEAGRERVAFRARLDANCDFRFCDHVHNGGESADARDASGSDSKYATGTGFGRGASPKLWIEFVRGSERGGNC